MKSVMEFINAVQVPALTIFIVMVGVGLLVFITRALKRKLMGERGGGIGFVPIASLFIAFGLIVGGLYEALFNADQGGLFVAGVGFLLAVVIIWNFFPKKSKVADN